MSEEYKSARIKLMISCLLLFLIISFLTKNPNADENSIHETQIINNNISDSFLVGAMNNGLNRDYKIISDSLGLNLWHFYIGMGRRNDGSVDTKGWDWWNYIYPRSSNDSLTADSSYKSIVQSRLDSNQLHNMKTIMHRPKIEYLSFGQRSDYQCEATHSNPDLWFYTFNVSKTGTYIQDITDNSAFGNGAKVKYCHGDPSNALARKDTIVKRLQANNEQADAGTNGPIGDKPFDWYIKPRIRIDSNEVDNNPNKKVCRIDVYNYYGDGNSSNKIKSVDLLAINFAAQDTVDKYDGKYREDFFNFPTGVNLILTRPAEIVNAGGNKFNPDNKDWWKPRGDRIDNPNDTAWCKVDFQVYWYGECDMWIDYLRVDNEIANRLLTKTDDEFEKWIRWESELADHNNSPLKFYIELSDFNTIPCMSYVSKKLTLLTNNNVNIVTDFTWNRFFSHFQWPPPSSVMNAAYIKRNYIDSIGMTQFYAESYPLTGSDPSVLPPYPNTSYIPNTLPQHDSGAGTGILAAAIAPSNYDTWLQKQLDKVPYNEILGDINVSQVQDPGNFRFVMELGDNISKLADIPFINMAQDHLWYTPPHEIRREPTNEELSMLANVTLCYGARGIMYFNFDSHGSDFTANSYGRGIVEVNGSPRHYNVYGQRKWDTVKSIIKRLKKWGPAIMSFDNVSRKTFIYRLHYGNLSSQTYINQLKAYKPSVNVTDTSTSISGLNSDDQDSTYLQLAVFKNPAESLSNYFMVVNRRCSPYISNSSNSNIGGKRILTIKFDSTDLEGFNNWKIINIENNTTVKTFAKSSLEINLGIFQPGEGKLYNLAPVMQEGGTLVTNEDCGGEIDCKGEVNNNGKDINIKPGATINFTNTSARLNMDGGTFKSGICQSENTAPVYLRGKNGNFWKGLLLNECSEVEIATTYFENISPYPVDSTYAIQLIDCEYINVTNSHFTADLDIKTGGVLINYTSALRVKEAYINYNHFQMDAGDMPALSITTTGYITFPLIIEGNVFESYNGNSLNAILLSGVAGGAIKENQIIGYRNGMILIWSVMDIYGNNIFGGDDDSNGVLCYASSYTNLSPNGFIYTGGLNSISSEGENSACIELDNSFLYLDYGFNTFDLKNYGPGSAFHISGTIPTDICDESAGEAEATYNCFKVSDNDTEAVHNVECLNQDPFNFNFDPYYCGDQESVEIIVYNLGNGNYDTLLTGSSGSGGGESNYQLSIYNDQSNENVEKFPIGSFEDSVSINLRKRDYERVSELCYDLLTHHIDSLKDISILSKLYLAELKLDSAGNKISNLKTFLEELILNNPEKESLIEQSFYLIQKCKVSLGLYESAMTGFQEIVNQNPYSYEGLIASWDYAATSLLENSGNGGGFRDYNFDEENFNDDPADKYDKKKFTTENRKSIKKNILNSFQSGREKETEKVKILEKKVRDGNANTKETNKLIAKTILYDVIKIKNPNTTFEHIANVNIDIQKVFGGVNKNNENDKTQTLIPNSYSLSQNYPNPFNPVTKINFDLPQEGKVKLIVYDLLGREIQKLVNNELRSAGRHLVEFNGNNLSSGVYFYRLEVNDFVQTRRMILIK